MDRNVALEATSSDASPTPGYLLAELSKVSVSSYVASQQLMEFLVSRLNKSNNHHVKYKCVTIIKYICRNGSSNFKKEMSRNIQPIKEAMSFSGPPDPLHGDEYYRKVRTAAQEAMDAIFDSHMPETTSAVKASHRIQGFGGTAEPRPIENNNNNNGINNVNRNYNSGNGTYNGNGSSFTNTNMNSSDKDNSASSYLQSMTSALSSVATSAMNYTKQVAASATGSSNSNNHSEAYRNYNNSGNPNNNANNNSYQGPTTGADLRYSNSSTNSYSSNISNNANNNYNNNNNNNNNGIPQYLASNRQLPSSLRPNAYSDNSNSNSNNNNNNHINNNDNPPQIMNSNAANDGKYEDQLVANLCEAGGMRVAPPQDKLDDLIRSAPTLSEENLGGALTNVLNADKWQSRVKALMVILELCKSPACHLHAIYWKQNIEFLQALNTDSKATVRAQAKKVIDFLNTIEGGGVASNVASPGAAATGRGQEMDLLDIGTSAPAHVVELKSLSQSQTQASTGSMSIFEGMGMSSSSSSSTGAIANTHINNAALNESPLNSFLSQPTVPISVAPPPASAPPPSGGTGFSFLNNPTSTDNASITTTTTTITTSSSGTSNSASSMLPSPDLSVLDMLQPPPAPVTSGQPAPNMMNNAMDNAMNVNTMHVNNMREMNNINNMHMNVSMSMTNANGHGTRMLPMQQQQQQSMMQIQMQNQSDMNNMNMGSINNLNNISNMNNMNNMNATTTPTPSHAPAAPAPASGGNGLDDLSSLMKSTMMK